MRKIHLKYCREVIFVVVVCFCSIGSIYAQVEQTVSGVVKDVAGEPLIGVSVLEAGTIKWCYYRFGWKIYVNIDKE